MILINFDGLLFLLSFMLVRLIVPLILMVLISQGLKHVLPKTA